jgi:hypothetical protein
MVSASAPVVESGAGDVSPTANASLGVSTIEKRMRTSAVKKATNIIHAKTSKRAEPLVQRRQRSRTGCLTCRKRRVKCGEERPTCGNCAKAQRLCEGYHQPTIFKTPLEGWPNRPKVVSTLQDFNSVLPSSRNTGFHPAQSSKQTQENASTHCKYTEIDPALEPLNTQPGSVAGIQHYGQDGHFPLPSSLHKLPTLTSEATCFTYFSSVQPNFHSQYRQEGIAGSEEQQQYFQAPYYDMLTSYNTHVDWKHRAS